MWQIWVKFKIIGSINCSPKPGSKGFLIKKGILIILQACVMTNSTKLEGASHPSLFQAKCKSSAALLTVLDVLSKEYSDKFGEIRS